MADKKIPPTLSNKKHIRILILPVAPFQTVKYFYEKNIPLENDPELRAANVTMSARVDVDQDGSSVNHIIFSRGKMSVIIGCVHTAIYTAPAQDIFALKEEDLKDLATEAERKPLYLPPWEHFVALKSFVAGIAAAGILWLLDPISLYEKEENSDSEIGLPLSTGLLVQIQRGLLEIAPDLMRPLLAQKLSEGFARAPLKWWIARWEILQYNYDIPFFLNNQSFMNALSMDVRKKIIHVFLHFCPDHGIDHVFLGRMHKCFPVIFSENILSKLPPTEEDEIFRIIVVNQLHHQILNRQWFAKDFIALFSLVISHEYGKLLDPSFLLQAIDAIGSDRKKGAFIFYDHTSQDYLRRLLRAFFAAWEQNKDLILGNLPYAIFNHLLSRAGITAANVLILEELNFVAPSSWYRDYIVPFAQDRPDLEALFGKRLKDERKKITFKDIRCL